MNRKLTFLWKLALLLSGIGFSVAVVIDASRSESRDVWAAETDVTKATATTNPKRSTSVVDNKAEETPDSAKRSADEDAIRLTGDDYVKAYCAADAKSIAAQYTPDAEYIDEQGNLYQGREAIEEAMKTLFTANTGCQIGLEIQTIRFVSPGLAVEDGTMTFTASNGSEPTESRYTAMHVKTNGKWFTASVREHAPKVRRQQQAQLKHLDWLRGDWVDESEDAVVIFSCDAIDGGNYLLRKFGVHIVGQDAMSGTQRIGWDPLTGKLRAWIFDSEGGFSDGLWHYDDKGRWMLKSTGVTADGQPASNTSIYTFVNEDTMTWQSVDHEIAGVALPDSEVVTIVRWAPIPQIAIEADLSKSN